MRFWKEIKNWLITKCGGHTEAEWDELRKSHLTTLKAYDCLIESLDREIKELKQKTKL